MSELIVRLTKEERKQWMWIRKARSQDRNAGARGAIIKIGNRLFCVDGFRVYSIPCPKFNQPEFQLYEKIILPLTPIQSIMVIEDNPDLGQPPKVSQLTPRLEDQICAFAINPRYLSEALHPGQMSNIVRVFKSKEGKPNLVIVTGLENEVAYIMPMLVEIKNEVPQLVESCLLQRLTNLSNRLRILVMI